MFVLASIAVVLAVAKAAVGECNETRLHLSDPPYENYFYSDCNSASQVVITSPLPDSNLSVIEPRLLVAWPAGDSGVVALFRPQDGPNGSLAISLQNCSTGDSLEAIYEPSGDGDPVVGVSGCMALNTSANLYLAILGSIRTMRDFTEGGGLLHPVIQDAVRFEDLEQGGVGLSRLWFDNITTTNLAFRPTANASVKISNRTVDFDAGTYVFNASFNYPQLKQLSTQQMFDSESQGIAAQSPAQAKSLSFLSYSDKLLAGAWRFLTYFGRDSMISLMLMEPILSVGEGSATEAVIGAVLERLNRTDGSAAHEETIGDYATFVNLQQNKTSTAPSYDYKMVDTDFYLPVVLADYLLKNPVGQERATAFVNKTATINPANSGLTYGQLALINAEKIMNISTPFAEKGGQIKDNLVHLKDGQTVGQWRDSDTGLGGGRIPYDVNTALVPAALRAIAALADAGFFPSHPDWNTTASKLAKVWEDGTLCFFEVQVPKGEARALVESYVANNSLPFPSHSDSINASVTFHGLALDSNGSVVRVMNTDDCFRLFLLNTTNDAQLAAFLDQTANHILGPFPAGLSTDAGLVVANPVFGDDPAYARNFTSADYHGTVVWSWQLAMMAAGLERQLDRCQAGGGGAYGCHAATLPAFCRDSGLRTKVIAAYNHLWDLIEANRANLSNEVWSWRYQGGKFAATPLGAFSATESDIVQLWSLTFLAVRRNEPLR